MEPVIDFVTGRYSWVSTDTMKKLYVERKYPQSTKMISNKFHGPILVIHAESGKVFGAVQMDLPSKLKPRNEKDLKAVAFIEHFTIQDMADIRGYAVVVVSFPDGEILATKKISNGYYYADVIRWGNVGHVVDPHPTEILELIIKLCPDVTRNDMPRWTQ